jgi:hypothetical protein
MKDCMAKMKSMCGSAAGSNRTSSCCRCKPADAVAPSDRPDLK